MITTDAALQRVKGIKKSFDNGVKNKLEQYMDNRVINFYPTSEISEIFTSTESISGMQQLSELESPPVITLDDGYSVTLTENRYGSALMLPEAVYKREGKDTTWKVDAFLMRQRDLAMKAAVNTMLVDAFSMLNNAFDSSADTLAPDSVELCGTHSWASGETFDNAVTDALDVDAVDDAFEYAGAFTDAKGIPMPLNFDTIVVKKGSAAEREARRQFAEHISPTAVGDINLYEGAMTIIATPYITATNKTYWFMLDSSIPTCLGMGIGQYPMMNEPIVQNNQSILTNITSFYKFGILNMPFELYGSTGAV